MKQNDNFRLPFFFTAGGTEIKVYKAGRSLRLRSGQSSAKAPENLGGIHSHFAFEVFFAVAEPLSLVTDRDTAVYSRQIALLPPKLRHYSFSPREGNYCLLFTLNGADVAAQRLSALLGDGICTLKLEEDDAFYIRRAAETLETGRGEEARLLIQLLFTRMLRRLLPDSREAPAPRTSEHMNAIETFINDNLTANLTLGSVAEHVHLSPRQVSRIIQQEWDCTLVQLITEKRLARAEMLLKNTTLPISQIAAAICCGTPNHFYSLFRHRYGVTPLQYRKSQM